MPYHKNKTSFKKGQNFLPNGVPMGFKYPGYKPWNYGLKGKNDLRCKIKESTKKKLHKIFKNRKMPWMKEHNARGKDPKKWKISKCKFCHSSIKHLKCQRRVYCSHKCKDSDKQLHKLVGKKAKATNLKNGTYKKNSIRMKNGGALHASKRNQRISKWQREIYNKIKKVYPDAKLEFKIKTLGGIKAIDIYIPSLKQCIECDGDYWHKDRKHKDYKRQKHIEYLGYKVYRIKESDYNGTTWVVPKF